MALTAKEIQVIRMIVREEVARNNGTPVSATVQSDSYMRYATSAPVAPTYIVGNYPFQQALTENEYSEYLAKLTE